MLYISAVYWAITTCATVGYGDIIPWNEYEMSFCIGVMIIGVAAFSFALSDLSTQFIELRRTVNLNEERERSIKELEKRFRVDKDVLDRIKAFFDQNEDKLDFTSNLEMVYLLRTLPSFLKTQMALFLYREAMAMIKFL